MVMMASMKFNVTVADKTVMANLAVVVGAGAMVIGDEVDSEAVMDRTVVGAVEVHEVVLGDLVHVDQRKHDK